MFIVKLTDVEMLSVDICKRITLVMEQLLQLGRDIKYFSLCCTYTLKTHDFVLYYDGINVTFYKIIFK